MSKRVPRHKPKAKVQRPLPPASSISCGTTPCSCKNGSRAVNAINERGELVFKRCEQLEEDAKRQREAALREKHYNQLHALRERHLREMEADTRDEVKERNTKDVPTNGNRRHGAYTCRTRRKIVLQQPKYNLCATKDIA